MNNKMWRVEDLDSNKIFALTLPNPRFLVKAAILADPGGKMEKDIKLLLWKPLN